MNWVIARSSCGQHRTSRYKSVGFLWVISDLSFCLFAFAPLDIKQEQDLRARMGQNVRPASSPTLFSRVQKRTHPSSLTKYGQIDICVCIFKDVIEVLLLVVFPWLRRATCSAFMVKCYCLEWSQRMERSAESSTWSISALCFLHKYSVSFYSQYT